MVDDARPPGSAAQPDDGSTSPPGGENLARELGSSALLLGLSFAVTAAVVTAAQAAAALLS